MKIDRTGTFLVVETDRALGRTPKAKLPQLTLDVRVVHWFDEALDNGNGDWVDFSECSMEGRAFCTLAYVDKEGNKCKTFQHDNLMETYGWSGKDYGDLAAMTAPEMFQVRVEDNDPAYADKNPYVINKIAPADADPRGGLKKLDDVGIAALNAEFGAMLNKAGKAAPPASAKKAPPAAPPTAAKPSPAAPTVPAPVTAESPKLTAAQKKAAKKAKSDRVAADNAKIEANKKAKAGAATKAPPTPPPAASTVPTETVDVATDVTPMTKEEAYNQVFEMQAAGTTDEARNAAWGAAIKQVAGDIDQKDITGEQWYQIMHETLNDVGAV